jgi:hypothetical protein
VTPDVVLITRNYSKSKFESIFIATDARGEVSPTQGITVQCSTKRALLYTWEHSTATHGTAAGQTLQPQLNELLHIACTISASA